MKKWFTDFQQSQPQMRKLEVDVSKGTGITSAKDLLFFTDSQRCSVKSFSCTKNASASRSDILIYSDIHIGGGVHQVSFESGNISLLLQSNDHNTYGIGIWKGHLVFSDPKSHQVKILNDQKTTQVLAGTGKCGRSFGYSSSAHMTQPTGMVVCGNTIFVVISAEGSVFLITGITGIVNVLNSLKDLNDAFMIHTDESVTVKQFLKLLQEAYTFYKAAKMVVHEKYNLQCKALQGPQGCVPSDFIDSIVMLLDYLFSIQEDYITLYDKFSPAAISTRPNETFFSLVRNLVVTPNPLEFAMTAPTIIIKMVKKVTDLPFLYETKDHSFYEASKNFLPAGCISQIPKQNEVKLTEQAA